MNTLAILAILANAEVTHGIPTGLLQALCTVESNLNPHAVVEKDGIGGRASIGLCQVQIRTASYFSPGISAQELLGPGTNAHIAGAYLAYNYRRYGTWVGAVIAYNKGNWTGGVNSYYSKVLKEWRENGGYKRHQKITRRRGKRGNNEPDRSAVFLREDYADAATYR